MWRAISAANGDHAEACVRENPHGDANTGRAVPSRQTAGPGSLPT
jgi:hypothetical protein